MLAKFLLIVCSIVVLAQPLWGGSGGYNYRDPVYDQAALCNAARFGAPYSGLGCSNAVLLGARAPQPVAPAPIRQPQFIQPQPLPIPQVRPQPQFIPQPLPRPQPLPIPMPQPLPRPQFIQQPLPRPQYIPQPLPRPQYIPQYQPQYQPQYIPQVFPQPAPYVPQPVPRPATVFPPVDTRMYATPKPTPAPAKAGTCKDTCGHKDHANDCWCDQGCLNRGDCCPDFITACPFVRASN